MKAKLRSSRYVALYNFRESKAKGRTTILLSAALSGLAQVLTTGLFLTGFLINNGIDLTNIGILTFVPYIASLFAVVSPLLLERFPRRRWLLAAGRFLYYTFYSLGVTLVPAVIHGSGERIACMLAMLLVGNILNVITTSGYNAWQISFLPEEIRAEHFGVFNLVSNIAIQGFGLVFAFVVDAFAGTKNAANVIVWLRYFGYAVALLDVIVLTLPDEYPYEKSEKQLRLQDIFTKPLKNRGFSARLLIIAGYTFFSCLPNAVLNYYLLQDLSMKYSYIEFINMLYPVALLVFLEPCRRLLNRYGWLRVFSVGTIISGITFLPYALVVKGNCLILYPAVRIVQHIISALFIATPYADLQYMNLPREDRTNYLSFYILILNAFTLLGLMCGTWFVALEPNLSFSVLGIGIGNIQLLIAVEGVGFILVGWLVGRFRNRIHPVGNGAA